MEDLAITRVIRPDEARVNVTYARQNGELSDPVLFDAPEGDIKGWVTEAIRTGSVPGIQADPNVDLHDYIVDRFAATEARPFSLLQLRPKTAFGTS